MAHGQEHPTQSLLLGTAFCAVDVGLLQETDARLEGAHTQAWNGGVEGLRWSDMQIRYRRSCAGVGGIIEHTFEA